MPSNDFTRTEILELAREFRRRRTFLNISQLKLARIANLSQSIINKFESGKIDPAYSTILKIEHALHEQEHISESQAEHIMSKDIQSILPATKLVKALELMRINDFSQLIIKRKEQIIGTIYEKSILDALAKKINIYTTTIKGFVKPAPIIIPPDYPAADLLVVFQNKNTKCVLVGKENKLLGIITKSDLFKKR